MRADSERIYAGLIDSGEKPERASRITWSQLKEKWKKGKDGKWVKKSTKTNARFSPMMQIPSGGVGATTNVGPRCTRFKNTVLQGLDQWLPDDEGRVQGTFYPKSAFEPTHQEWGQGVPIVFAGQHPAIGGLATNAAETLKKISTDDLMARIVGYSVGVALLDKNIGRPLLRVDLGDICDAEVQNLYDDARLGISSAFTDRETEDGRRLVGDVHPDHILLFPRNADGGTEQRDLSAVVLNTLNQMGGREDVTEEQKKPVGRMSAFVAALSNLVMTVEGGSRENFNPNHDESGRFTSGGGGGAASKGGGRARGGPKGESWKAGENRKTLGEIAKKSKGLISVDDALSEKGSAVMRLNLDKDSFIDVPVDLNEMGINQYDEPGPDVGPPTTKDDSELPKGSWKAEAMRESVKEVVAKSKGKIGLLHGEELGLTSDEAVLTVALDKDNFVEFPVNLAELDVNQWEENTLSRRENFNPNHDESGRFTSGGGGSDAGFEARQADSDAKARAAYTESEEAYKRGDKETYEAKRKEMEGHVFRGVEDRATRAYTKQLADPKMQGDIAKFADETPHIASEAHAEEVLQQDHDAAVTQMLGRSQSDIYAMQEVGRLGVDKALREHGEGKIAAAARVVLSRPLAASWIKEYASGKSPEEGLRAWHKEMGHWRVSTTAENSQTNTVPKEESPMGETEKKAAGAALQTPPPAAPGAQTNKCSEAEIAAAKAQDEEDQKKGDETNTLVKALQEKLASQEAQLADIKKRMSEDAVIKEAATKRDFMNLLKPGVLKAGDQLYAEFKADPVGYMKSRANTLAGSGGETDLTGLEHVPGGSAVGEGPLTEKSIKARAAQLGARLSDEPARAGESTVGRAVFNTATGKRDWVPFEPYRKEA